MSETSEERLEVDFNCPVAATTVKIERHYTVRISRAGKHLGRDLSRTDCSNKDHCRVATHGAGGRAYDWSKCAYLNPASA